MRYLIALVLAAVAFSAAAQTPQPPEIAARTYLLVDTTANQILASKAIDSPVEPASLTKLMVAYLVFDAVQSKKIDLQQTLPVSERAAKVPGARMFIESGQQVPVQDLIRGMVVLSANDATMALAEGVGGNAERFVQMMNEQAQALGMKSTAYRNPMGLAEAGHTTTARDLGTLATRLMADFPELVPNYAIKKYRYPGAPASNENNTNLLLFRDPTVDGLATGLTDAAGYGMVATARRDFSQLASATAPAGTPAARGARRMLAVVLGTESENARANETQKLLNWGYTAYEAVKLFDANQAVISPAVWKGSSSTVALGRFQPVVVAVPSGAAARIKIQIQRSDPLLAPLAKGQQAATLHVTLGDQAVADVPLLALDGVAQAGVLGRAWDALRLWIR